MLLFEKNFDRIMKTILITGGTAGIGKALVSFFDKEGYRVLFTARNEAKAKTLLGELKNASYYYMDYSNFSSVVKGVQNIQRDVETLDVLINNAGTWQMEFVETQDGIETNFAVNHLAPMLLTLELLPLLNNRSRIVNTSSGAHRRNILNLSDLEFRKQPYNGVATYSQSKLCNLLFTLALKKRLKNQPITVNSVHPGYVKTELFNQMTTRDWTGVPDASQGARSAVYAALSMDLEGISGRYIYLEKEDSNLSPLALDETLAAQLWEQSLIYIQPFLTQKTSL